MIISSDDLINLPVYTQGGDHLGRVVSFELDVDSNAISKYHIKTGLIKDLWHEQLIIDESQVIEITKDKMVVVDATDKKMATDLKPVKLAT